MGIRAHVLGRQEPEFSAKLESAVTNEVELSLGDDIPDPAEFEVLIAGVPQRKHLTASPNLHTLIIPWAGLPKATRELLLEYPDLSVHNIHHNAVPAAEMAITMMLAASKEIITTDRSFRNDDWSMRYEDSRAILLRGKTSLILGYGAIGREIANMCHGFGMDVLALGRSSVRKQDRHVSLYPSSYLTDLLPRANVLFVSVPFTPETDGMIGDRQLELLPDQAIIVNVSRGPVIDESALYGVLKSGRIRAGLDVWYDYPRDEADRTRKAPSAYPFNELENVIMTPHMAGHSVETESRRAEAIAELLNCAAEGSPLPGKINPVIGY